jgi:3-oxoacyl-[acyl-carrier protein] reductase
MMRHLVGQAALVTGAASGIGKAIALELVRRGASVMATDIDERGLRALACEGGWEREGCGRTIPLDVRDPDAWERAITATREAFGKIDLLIHCAGVLVPVDGHRTPAAEIHRVIDVNVKGAIFGANAAARVMVSRRSGHIVVIASIAGIVPVPGISVYSASKHAARAYAIALAQELRPYGVYVTAVCPGVVATPMMDAQLESEAAVWTFSGPRPLEVDEVVGVVIDRVLVRRPMEVVVDVPWTGQGLFAKVVNLVPDLGAKVAATLARRGREQQRRLRARARMRRAGGVEDIGTEGPQAEGE